MLTSIDECFCDFEFAKHFLQLNVECLPNPHNSAQPMILFETTTNSQSNDCAGDDNIDYDSDDDSHYQLDEDDDGDDESTDTDDETGDSANVNPPAKRKRRTVFHSFL